MPFVQDNGGILEAYVKSWTSEVLDKAAARGSVIFALVDILIFGQCNLKQALS